MSRAEGPHYPECGIDPCICKPLTQCAQRTLTEERVRRANTEADWLYGKYDHA